VLAVSTKGVHLSPVLLYHTQMIVRFWKGWLPSVPVTLRQDSYLQKKAQIWHRKKKKNQQVQEFSRQGYQYLNSNQQTNQRRDFSECSALYKGKAVRRVIILILLQSPSSYSLPLNGPINRDKRG
jgi:hypothetical protein